MTFEVRHGDCVELMAAMPAGSVDAVVCDPPYGLEFMGKTWDSFRVDDPGTMRHRGEAAGTHGELISQPDIVDGHPARNKHGVAYGGGKRPTTNRCVGCGKRDQFRNVHEPCGAGTWKTELIDPFTAPPTMLAFQNWCRAWALEALRVLKPGGHLLAFGGTRTYHRLACAVEDAGFEIRDTICWLYGSGFPKSLDVSKAIDRAAGAEPVVTGPHATNQCPGGEWCTCDTDGRSFSPTKHPPATAPATPEAERWEGWGTALKPAHEPVVVARKPLSGTVAATVLEHGTGALNVDGCRVGHASAEDLATSQAKNPGRDDLVSSDVYGNGRPQQSVNDAGRWPANVVLSHMEECVPVGTRKVKSNTPASYVDQGAEATLYGDGMGKREPGDERPGYADPDGTETVTAWRCHPDCPVRLLDEQTGELHSHGGGQSSFGGVFGNGQPAAQTFADSGGASRFFYVAKASRGERNAGLEGFEERALNSYSGAESRVGRVRSDGAVQQAAAAVKQNVHPTVKPISLMRWLVRLVTPPGGTVLDPFTGSGSTGCAAVLEGFDFIGLEREAEYVAIANARIAWWLKHRGDGEAAEILAAGELRDSVEATGQLGMFD